MSFERVHTMTDYYDGPRGGVAEFGGIPHLYENEWDDAADNYASTFRLSPISPDLMALALEHWDIWERWWTAFYSGLATQETRPALPADRARHDELDQILKRRLKIDPHDYIRARATFRTVLGWDGRGLAPNEVEWERC